MAETRPSSERLAVALAEAGLADLAPRARANEWHAYDSAEANPRRRLLTLLEARSRVTYSHAARAKINALRAGVRRGDFDAPFGESRPAKPKPSLRDRAAKSGLILP